MEKITEFSWNTPNGRELCEYFYEEPLVILKRNGVLKKPEAVDNVLNGRNQDTDVFNASWLREILSRKNYDKLFISNKHILDFLNARLGG